MRKLEFQWISSRSIYSRAINIKIYTQRILVAAVLVMGRTRHTKKELKQATEFLCDVIFKRLSKNIYIEIRLIKDKLRKEGSLADIFCIDRPRNSRMFDFEIDNNLSYKSTICSIAHELIHARQFARGELSATFYPPYLRYKGEIINEDETRYFELPYEFEPHAREDDLYFQWLAYRKTL
jgi:hypothetical protein